MISHKRIEIHDLLDRSESSFRFLRNLVDIKDRVEKFFAEKSGRFRKTRIFKLRERCEKLVEQNGTYIIQ